MNLRKAEWAGTLFQFFYLCLLPVFAFLLLLFLLSIAFFIFRLTPRFPRVQYAVN